MLITDILLAILISTVLVVTPCVISTASYHRQRNRTIAEIAASACPACEHMFGSGISESVSRRVYQWYPAPGYSISQSDLPSETIGVTCPHCGSEFQYRLDGRLFERSA